MCTMLLCLAFWFADAGTVFGPFADRATCDRVRLSIGAFESACWAAPAVLADQDDVDTARARVRP